MHMLALEADQMQVQMTADCADLYNHIHSYLSRAAQGISVHGRGIGFSFTMSFTIY